MPLSRICGGHWVTWLVLYYEVDTSGGVPTPIKDMGTTTLGKMHVLVRGVGQQWRVLNDDIVEPPRQVEAEHNLDPTFERRQRSRHVVPD